MKRTKHGMSKTRIYRTWSNMKHRCYNPKDRYFHKYGGRGITVCDEWRTDFLSFYTWAMLHGYTDNLHIDRIDNDKCYSPDNCRFATIKENNRNRSITKLNIKKVEYMRDLYSKGTTRKQLYTMFDVTPRHIRLILDNKSWRF